MVKLSHKLIANQVWKLSTGSSPAVVVTSLVTSSRRHVTSEFSANSGHFRNDSRQKVGLMGKCGAHSPKGVGRRAEGGPQASSSVIDDSEAELWMHPHPACVNQEDRSYIILGHDNYKFE